MSEEVLTSFDQRMLTRVESYLKSVRRDLRLPGLSVSVVHDDRMIYSAGFGSAGPDRAVDARTPFILGSLSKSFTAFAIMQLVDCGKLRLDDSVQAHIPWFAVAGSAGSDVTIRHLLTHTGGLSRYVGRELLSGRGDTSIEQSVRDLAAVKLVHIPGSQFEYSNLNYLVLALLIEVVSGVSYPYYVEQRIFEPLSMHESSAAPVVAPSLAQGYRWWFGWPLPFDAPYLSDALGAAFLISSASDMAQWLLLHLGNGSLGGIRFLSPSAMDTLHRPYVPTKKPGSAAAMGWRVEKLAGESILRHGGEVSNFRSDMMLVPSQGLGVVVLANCNNGMVAQLGLDQIALNVTRLLLGLPLPQKRLTFRGFYGLVDLLVVGVSLLQVGSLVQLLRSSSRRSARFGIGDISVMAAEVIGSLLVLWQLPRWADMPWRGLLLYVPDVSRWVVGMVSVSFLKSLVWLYMLF